MTVWDKIKARFSGGAYTGKDNRRYAFVDTEIGLKDHKIHDIGALRDDDATYHGVSRQELDAFLGDVKYLCGHNIVHHDARYLYGETGCRWRLVDTLYLSPLLYPEHPYHKLVKDDKLVTEQVNNPVNDCEKARTLLFDEVEQWHALPDVKRRIFTLLLRGHEEFDGFLEFTATADASGDAVALIKDYYDGKICSHADIARIADDNPVALAYALALIDTGERRSITPGWVLHNYPEVEYIIRQLRYRPCEQGCRYCALNLDVRIGLKRYFGYDRFRTYDGEPLQELAATAAVGDNSLLAIFPTGGGKSLTFQLPALMAGNAARGLTVVISPLQSLMKDQIDNLADRGITDAVTINGLLDPISRAAAIERVSEGEASLLYISPEMLRSTTIEHILLNRNVVRFVIDEAHCFSSWGQDFRVDYLYIGKFISRYMERKRLSRPISVSCFTATAKQKVIQDICDYFKRTLGLTLKLFASSASRTNLQYSVIHADTEDEKYNLLRNLINESNCPTIIYVSRTRRTREIAARLTRDGIKALPFNGRMSREDKVANQDAFMTDKVRVIVATSAFGMGVDKSDVGMVIHYDISDSLENYVQEAGRAGRDPELNAKCYVLYSDNDLDKHFMLLNQTKLSLSEIQQVWKAVKDLTRQRDTVNCSALEIARQAGWDDSVSDIETRVRTALSALEQSGYIERGNNVPHVYATGITVRNVDEARSRISSSTLFGTDEVEKAVRVIKSLISSHYTTRGQDAEAETRIDYLADILGLSKTEIISVVNRMRQAQILADSKDISAYLLDPGESVRKSQQQLDRFARLEDYLLNRISDETLHISYKQLNDDAVNSGIDTAREKDIRTLLYFLTIKGYARKQEDASHNLEVRRQADLDTTIARYHRRMDISRFVLDRLYDMVSSQSEEFSPNKALRFSVVQLLADYRTQSITGAAGDTKIDDIEEALLYLSKIGALKLDGGFLVLYNAMNIHRLKDFRARYKRDDYRMLNEFYCQKIQQVHIVGEYANLMVRDYNAALEYVADYFAMDYRRFIAKYFKEDRAAEIERNLTPGKYRQLFGDLSPLQREIISDKESRCIVVAAGPGSGKTRVLVHKLASLLLLEDVKHEQLLMLTFSRAAATEFKQRLMALIGNAAHFVEIKTFHSYSFDLMGRVGNIDESRDVVARAAAMIRAGEAEPNRVGKTVLVIDEAQDMGAEEFELVSALMANNEEMRVIAVGDDDQNIFEFRGSDSSYMYSLLNSSESRLVEMTENYRSTHHPVAFANSFLRNISRRIKTRPILSMSSDDGMVSVTRHRSKILFQPIVDEMLSGRKSGTTCVLTQTNDEAAIMTSLLRANGFNARQIQSMDGLRYWNVVELRYFLQYIERRINTPVITDELWHEALQATAERYGTAESFRYLKRCTELFEETNRGKYLSDFKEFAFESSTEDFCDTADADVVVSTIHKAKGREYDNVYMLIAVNHQVDDALLRRYYVGMTRARNHLSIHTDSDLFGPEATDRYKIDDRDYGMPSNVVLQLTHKDVILSFFTNRKSDILALRGGDWLSYSNYMLYNPLTGKPVARLAARMQPVVDDWIKRGYTVESATVRFVVAWRPKDAPKSEQETAVLLADMHLIRGCQ
ncbi:MAG: RecQ family ATP-dependent DNA helicase [Lachnoclostridium sp.]|nr:RecQ family ATP-dependent DNA helicase [Lachnoclostridium sp.]